MPIFFSTLIFYYSSLIIIIIISNKFFYFPNKNITFHFHPSKNPRPYCNETMHNFPANISTSLIFQFPNSFTSKRRGEKKHEEADFEKGMEISRKTTCKYFVSRGEKGSIYRPFLPTAGLWIKSRRWRAHSWSEAESLGEKTHEIGRLLAINRHPPTFPLNKSARHILDTRIPSWRSCFRPISPPLANFECVIRGKWDEVVEMKSRFFYAQVVYANLKYY